MEAIEFRSLAGFRIKLFAHEIKQITEHSLVNKAPGPEPGTELVNVKPYCEVLTSWGQVHAVDATYDQLVPQVFG